MWTLPQAAYQFRGLREGMQGWDVYAVQTIIGGPADGIFGPDMREAVVQFQLRHKLVADGIAGTATQKAGILAHLWPQQAKYDTIPGLARGMVEGESAFLAGNMSATYLRYESGNWLEKKDCGVSQLQCEVHDEAMLTRAFHVPTSLARMCKHVRDNFNVYLPAPNVRWDRRKAWELACGSWNAPAYTNYLAGVRPWGVPGPRALAALDSYIQTKTIYVRWG